MRKRMRSAIRLMRLCRKYGYSETETLLRRKLERMAHVKKDDPPILLNLSQQEGPKE